jgi:hypothetical protein
MLQDNYDDLKCIICLDLFEQPVSLYCGHSFCKYCIQKHLQKTPKCPLCKYPILGFQEFKVNIAIQKIVEKISQDNSLARKHHDDEPTAEPKPKDQVIREEKLYPESTKEISSTQFEDRETDALLGGEGRRESIDDSSEFYAQLDRSLKLKTQSATFVESSRRQIKCIGFEMMSKTLCFFPETLYKVKLKYRHSDELFKAMLPDHHFVGIVPAKKDYPKLASLFQLISISGFAYDYVEVVARCKSRIEIEFINTIDFAENDDFLRKYQHNGEAIHFEYVCGIESTFKAPELDSHLQRRLEDIDMKLAYYLHMININNAQIYDIIHLRYNIDSYQEKLSVDWKTDTYKYLCIAVSMLNIPDKYKEIAYFSKDIEAIVRIIHEYLKGATPENDPIFFINYGAKNQVSNVWTNLGVLIAVVIFIMSVYYPKIKFLGN